MIAMDDTLNCCQNKIALKLIYTETGWLDKRTAFHLAMLDINVCDDDHFAYKHIYALCTLSVYTSIAGFTQGFNDRATH